MRRTTCRLILCLPFLATACVSPRGDRPAALAVPIAERQGLKDDGAIRSLLFIFALIVAASLSACALFRIEASWVDDLDEADAVHVASTIAALVSDRIVPGDKAILLAPARMSESGDRLAAKLRALLEAQGHRLAGEDAHAADVHRLRILITGYSGGYVLRVTLDDAEASTMLSRGSDGQLVASVPLTIREAIR